MPSQWHCRQHHVAQQSSSWVESGLYPLRSHLGKQTRKRGSQCLKSMICAMWCVRACVVVQVIADVLKEFAPSARCSYNGTTIASLTAGTTGALPGEWETFVATIKVPDATTAQNGTALQLRITPPASLRGLGATVWFDNVTVVES